MQFILWERPREEGEGELTRRFMSFWFFPFSRVRTTEGEDEQARVKPFVLLWTRRRPKRNQISRPMSSGRMGETGYRHRERVWSQIRPLGFSFPRENQWEKCEMREGERESYLGEGEEEEVKIMFVAMAGDPSGAGRTDEMVDEVRESPSP